MVDGIFVGLSILTVGSAIITLESRELLYGGIALAISMLGIAGYFIIIGCSVCSNVSDSCICRGCCSFNYFYCDAG